MGNAVLECVEIETGPSPTWAVIWLHGLGADGQVVLMHDATLERTTNGTGAVSAMDLARLRLLDAGIRKGPALPGVCGLWPRGAGRARSFHGAASSPPALSATLTLPGASIAPLPTL